MQSGITMEDSEDDIAVIGIGCSFPGGETLDKFWRVLLEGKNCAVDIPAERFDTSLWYDADGRKAGKTQTTKAALIEGFNELDHKFFGIPEVEADLMDPQQKLLLQCTYRALEDAGLAMERVSGSRTGVYIGLMNRDYETLRSISPTTITHYSATGTAMSVAANRISFTFNFTGPSFALDSACSSSLVAVHLGCQAIKQGDCEMALCGGVSCIIEPRVFVALSKAKMTSPEGTSKPFSSRADGYGRGEGCGVVLLKPLRKATRDHNKIWGIISKTGVNQDGRSVTPITKPSMVQQEELLRRIYSQSDLMNVQYVEAHGTGTPAGDPTEAGSIANVIAKARPAGSETLRIGSVKSNIGHTESAAGVAGLIKVLLMMKHQTIVPSVFYSEDSASVDAKALRISIPTKAERWETNGSEERVAGVNSFGFGGTNAHVIVREHRAPEVEQILKGCPQILVISAASEKSFTLTLTDTLRRLRSNQPVDLQALTYTSACGRTHSRHKHRKAFQTSSLSDLQRQLTPFLETKVEPFRPDMQVVFVFCGNGVAYRGMCEQLLRDVPVFRDTVTEVEKVFQRHKSIGLSKWLSGECDDLSKPDVVQPLLFAVQVGLASVLKTWGVRPDAVLGHSVGEVAAAHCSGLLSLEDAVKVLHHRSSLQSQVTGGKMLVVSNVAVEEILEMLQVFSGKICVAAFNSPQSCTLSGDGDAIDVLHERLSADKRLFLHVLDVPVAYHSHLMDPILEDIERSIGLLDANTMECKLLSTVTGGWYSEGDFCSGTYWAKNIREPVEFEETLRAATEGKQTLRSVVFVEIGPRRALQGNIRETLGSDAVVLHSAQPGSDCAALLSAVGRLFELGIDVDWHQLYRRYETLPAAFPVYQFETLKKTLNFEDVRRGDESFACPPRALSSPKHPKSKESVYVCNLAVATAPYLWEHKNNGASILPGAFYVDLAYASVMTSLGPNKLVSLLQLRLTFASLFTLTSDRHQLKVTLEHGENVGSFKIQSDATTHASGTYVYSGCPPLIEEPNICIDTIAQRCKLVMKRREIYSVLSQAGFEYGPVFKQLHEVHFGEEFKEAVTTLQVLGELLERLHDYFIHPVLLDYFLQMTAVVAIGQLTTRRGFPSAIGSVSISGALQEKMILYLRATQDTPDFLEVCGCFSTTDGKVLVELKGVRISFVGNCSNDSGSLFFHNEITAIKDERESNNFKIKALVFEDTLGIAEGLRQYLHPESVSVENRDCWMPGELHNILCRSLDTKTDFTDIIFIWAVEDLSHLSSEQTLDCLVTSCELFRQTVTALRQSRRACTVRVITHRATERSVDRVSAGSVLSGMTRACAAEMPGLSFQLIDLASVTREDICTLVHILSTCRKQEVMISRGRASATRIARSPVEDPAPCRGGEPPACRSSYALQTSDPYKMSDLSAVACDTNRKAVEDKSVEIQLTNLCTHSSDFFPVTTSHLNFGRTLYWNKHASENHSLLALDYSGIVTAVGKDVGEVRVGDHVAACYPVPAAAHVRIPEVACYRTRSLPFLREAPCVSFYMVAYEILQLMQPTAKQPRAKVVIVSSNPASAMIKVLALAANRSGWNVSTLQHFKGDQIHLDQGEAFVFLPPSEHGWQLIRDHGDAERHIVFVRGDHMSADAPALQSDHTHVHDLDVRNVVQKARLRAQSRKVFKWMTSLGFESAFLPLKAEVFQLRSSEGPQTDAGSESYFTAAAVQQVVLHHGEPGCSVSVPLVTPPPQLFKQGCVYIVSGGLSGLGLETVRFIAHHGGGFIATLSRSAPTDEARFKMELLQKQYRVAIANVRCDVSASQQVTGAVSEIEQRFCPRPVRGVFHSAAVLHDALIEGLDESAFRKVLRPKVSGALNLHYATLRSRLDFFVCYSSISSFIGNASQCNYAAANSFLDTFCHYRRNLGLAGQSINWGPLNLGLLLNKGHFQKFLEAKGMKIMDVCEVHEALRMCLLMNRAQQVICKFNFRKLNIHVLSQNASLRERLSPLVETELGDDVSVEQSFQSSSSTHETVKSVVSQISGVAVDELDSDSTLSSLGIDSMLAMTLQNNIFQETGVNVPLVRILDPHSTLSTVVTFVLNNG